MPHYEYKIHSDKYGEIVTLLDDETSTKEEAIKALKVVMPNA